MTALPALNIPNPIKAAYPVLSSVTVGGIEAHLNWLLAALAGRARPQGSD